MRLAHWRADEHLAVEPRRLYKAMSADRNLTATQSGRRKTQLLNVVEQRALVGQTYAEPAVEYAKAVRLQGFEAEQ